MPDEGREGIVRERKKCPVDRGKLMIALECCRKVACHECPYYAKSGGCKEQVTDALAYIGWMEEKLEGLGNVETD